MPELATSQWVFLVAITFGAGLIQAATGFGFAVIAVPLFLLTLDSLTVIQINIILNLFNALVVVPKLWRTTPKPMLNRLSFGALLGLPLGMVLFLYAEVEHIKLAVALLIIVFAGHLVLNKRRAHVEASPGRGATVAVGGVSGLLTSVLAMPGPPILIYLSHFSIPKDVFRSVNLTFYVFAYGLALLLQALLGGMQASTWWLAAALIPVVMLGSLTGHWVSPYLSERAFRQCVLVTLLGTGVYMLYSVLRTGA